jgi:hypothetical protein
MTKAEEEEALATEFVQVDVRFHPFNPREPKKPRLDLLQTSLESLFKSSGITSPFDVSDIITLLLLMLQILH